MSGHIRYIAMKVDKIRFSKDGFEMLLSPLEADVLETLWDYEKALVREIHSDVKKRRAVAVTSVAVILDRLHKKGLVSREEEKGRGGMHYIYTSIKNKEEFQRSVLDYTVDTLIEKFGPSALTYFSEKFSRKDMHT